MGCRGDFDRVDNGLAGYRDRQHRPARIAADLHVSPADAVWVVNVYQIALVATLLPLGALGEIVGHQRIYLWRSIAVHFGIAGLRLRMVAAEPADSAGAARLGRQRNHERELGVDPLYLPSRILGRGFGHTALTVATAFTLGPTIASAILAVGPWSWLFAINIPFGVLAILIGLKTLPATPRAVHSFDFPGAVLAAGCLGCFIIGIGSAAHGARPALVIVGLAAALSFGWLVSRRHADHPAPMLPIDLFRRPVFALSAATAVCSFSVQGLAFVSLPFYFEDVLLRTQVQTGFLMTPWPLVVAIMAPIGGRLSERYPAGILGGIGLALLSVGMTLLAMLPAAPSVADIAWRMVICGMGFGFFQTPNMKTLMSSAPPGRSGGASGIAATARLTGQTTGAALAALCFSLAGHGGATVALALGAGFAALGSLMSFLRLTVVPQRQA